MLNSQVIHALDLLVDYPDISDYIKHFNGDGGFMFTVEITPIKISLKSQMEQLLDPDYDHSGASWGLMLRHIQSVLNGVNSREQYLT
jgi:hypothetical protein